jgi:hypothetical protein
MAKDYAIVPEEEVLKLKSDVEKIKKNPFQAYGSEDLIESMNNLTKAINALLELFKSAAEEMKLEERETETIGRKMDPLFSKVDMLFDQNQKIARGIVAVADMLERTSPGKPGWREEQPAPITPQPMPVQPRPPIMPGPSGPMAPPRMTSMALPTGARPPTGGMPAPTAAGMPLPPPPVAKKKGLFG